jgi:4-hydroxy-tetrahydrodipicolinate reductase
MTLPTLGIVGASGRMGRALVRLAADNGFSVIVAVGRDDVGRDVGELAGIGKLGVVVDSDVSVIASKAPQAVIEFASPEATSEVAALALKHGFALVSGTTGLTDQASRDLDAAAKGAAVLWEPNMSIGVHVLSQLVAQAARTLASFDIEIVETHHNQKADAPSGTALRLAQAAASARESPQFVSQPFVYGREGRPGARKPSEIGVFAVRGGDVIGDHTVHLLGPGERLELSHRASSRDLFAHGALRAARWLLDQPPGRYGLKNMLG